MGSGEVSNYERRIAGHALHARRIAPHHSDFNFTGVAASGAWNFRSTKLEDGVERKRRAVLTRRRGVGETAGWPRGRQAGAVVSADRNRLINHEEHEGTRNSNFPLWASCPSW